MANSRLNINNIVDQAPDSPRGLFSSTLFQSSNAQTILPAKIRNKINDRWDMIFVHRHHITFRELHVEATLNHARGVKVMTGCWIQQYSDKSDLDSVITGAKILRVGNDDDYNPDPGVESGHWPMPLSENQPSLAHRGSSPSPETEQRNGGHSFPNRDPYPPNVLVLTLRRNMLDTLALLFAPEHTTSDRPDFCVVQRPMPGYGAGEYEDSLRLGAHLAVEPHGRAIAVAARETNLMFYKMKPRLAWKQDSSDAHGSADDQFEPFEEERSLPVDGTIMKIDFLQPDKSDGDTVVLLLVVSLDEGNSNQLQRWDWDTTKSLQDGLQQAWPAGFPIDKRVAQPQLLIPSVLDSGFWLLAGQVLARYSDVMTGSPSVSVRPMQTATNGHDVSYASLSRDQKKWNVFARPHRYGWQGRYRTESDLLYLGREDGRIQYLELGTGSEIDVKSELMMDTTPVWVDQTSDSAFAVIPRYVGDTEFVVTATGLFTIGPREEFRSRQLFCNWNPLQDFTLSRNSAYCVNGNSADQLISLRSAFTAITILPELDLPEAGDEKRWTLFDGPSVHLVSTTDSLTEITLLAPQSTDQPISGQVTACIDELFEPNLRTVFTMQTESGLIVQVTPESIRISRAKGALQIVQISGTASTAAASSDMNGCVLLVVDDQGSYLKYLHFLDSQNSSQGTKSLEYESHDFRLKRKIRPTCLACESCGNDSILIAVSTWEDGLLLLHAEKRGAMKIVQTTAPRTAYESMTIRRSQSESLLTLGTRTGDVHFIRLDSVHNEISSTQYTAGQQPVQLLDLDQGVLALCNGRLSLLECGILQGQVFSRRVILPKNEDKNTEGYGEREHEIVTMSLVPACFNTSDRQGVAIFTKADTLVRISSLSQCQAAGEHTPVFSKRQQEAGTEQTQAIKQISYVLPYGQYFAIPYKLVKLTPATGKASTANKSRRQVFAMLGFHDPKSKTLLDEQNSQAIHKASGPSVQNIYEWHPQVQGSRYRLLVVHTKTPPKAQRSPRASQPGPERGRVLIYTVDFKARPGKQLKLQEKLKRSYPIEYIAIYGDDSLILAWKQQIEIITLTRKDPEDEFKFQWKSRFLRLDGQLSEPVRQLRVTSSSQSNNFVHVTTHNQLKIVDENHSRIWESDFRPNMGQIHFHDDAKMPVVLVLSDDGILGYTYNPNLPGTSQGRFHRNDLHALFEARLLTRITCALPHEHGWYIGSSSESSFRQFKVLLENEWRLLRYLQNLAQQNRSVCPMSWRDNVLSDGSPRNPLDPSRLKPRDKKLAMHINGDILRRITAESLQDKLIPEGKAQSSEKDLSTAEARRELLRKYAEQVSPDLVKDRIYERVIEWIRTFWEPRI